MGKRCKVDRFRYSDADRAFALRALAARDGNVRRTARELGIPPATLHQWARGKRYGGWGTEMTRDGPLSGLLYFAGRALPVSYLGSTIPVDLGKLTAEQHADLARLLALARP